jgi:tRNA (guanine37-N1)-methyltransferase
VKVTIVTIFPDWFTSPFAEGMIRVAREAGRLELEVVNLRTFTDDVHQSVDDSPFGGGPGMIMKIEPIDRALRALAIPPKGQRPATSKVMLTSPQGPRFTQRTAIEWAGLEHLVLVCGRYKGVDERVTQHLVDEEFSIGDFVLSGGEPAALVVVDAVARLQEGVVGKFDSVESDSFHSGLLDCDYYTRPADYGGWGVPEVLLSGNHGKIAQARREEALRRTLERRPELLDSAELSAEDRKMLGRLQREREAARREAGASAPTSDASRDREAKS